MKKITYLLSVIAAVFLFSSCSRQYTYYQLIPRNASGGFASINKDKVEPAKKITAPLVAANNTAIGEQEKNFVLKKASFLFPEVALLKKKKANAVASTYIAENTEMKSSVKTSSPPIESVTHDGGKLFLLWILCLLGAIILSAIHLWFLALLAWIAFVVLFIMWLIAIVT